MREIRLSGSEGGGFEFNRFSLPLSFKIGHYQMQTEMQTELDDSAVR
jgi:hypothetical protein